MNRVQTEVNIERLRANLASVRARIAGACAKAGREPDSVALVAVTKTVSVEVVEALAGLGVGRFGENRVANAVEKVEQFERRRGLKPPVQWDFIGRLQRNKINKVVGRFGLIHSVDSVRLVEAIAARAEAAGLVQELLLQVNVSGEAAKQGFRPDEVAEAVRATGAAGLSGVRVTGLMTMAPLGAGAAGCARCFKTLREVAADVSRTEGVALPELSMGMSNDFEEAVASGATLVRLGTILFEGT